MSNKDKAIHVLKLIDSWLDFQTYIKEIPSVSVGIFMEDEVIFRKSYGYSNLETKNKATSSTLYRIGSHSKVFSTTIIMRLYAEDKLSLDDRVVKHLPWLISEKEDLSQIRIKHLLTHSSGISRDGTIGQWYTHNFPTLEELKRHIQEGIKVYETSEQLKYSNIGFTLVGQIIEKVTGKSFEDNINALTQELDMNNTYPDITKHNIPLHATGYGLNFPNKPRDVIEHVSARVMNSATGLSSTVDDLLKFYEAHFIGNGKLMPDYCKREMQSVQIKYKEIERGLGFGNNKLGKLSFYGHGGGYPGFITLSGMNHKYKLVIVVLTNAINGPTWTLFTGISNLIDYVIQNYDDFNSDENLEPSVLNLITGFYHTEWSVTLYQEINGKLISIPAVNENPTELIEIYSHIEDLKFTIKTDNPFGSPGERLEFVKQKNGEYHIESGGGISKKFEFSY